MKPGHFREWCALLSLLFFGAAQAGAAAPRWLLDDAKLAPAAKEPEKGAEILRSEHLITVNPDGTWVHQQRTSIRVVHAGGASWAQFTVPYVERADRIGDAAAWLVRDGRTVRTLARREWIDAAAVDDVTLYSDFRGLIAVCNTAAAGDVFGGEVIARRSSPGGQEVFNLSQRLPVRLQRLVVQVPRGWSAQLLWLRGAGAPAQVSPDGLKFTWEVRDIPAEVEEPWSSEEPSLRAALIAIPPAGSDLPALIPTKSWRDVGAWLHRLQDPQCDRSPGLTATAERLTRGLSGPREKLEAITRYVQSRRYIQVNRNNGLGFGFRPRRASEVLEADYGDCKDKSNLLRALLHEAGFQSELVAAYVGDRAAVHPEWPSPGQFNHAILLIRLPENAEVPGAFDLPGYGRVVFFDSTVRWIPLGHLPWQLQGSKVLVCDGASEGLIELPRVNADSAYAVDTSVELKLSANGTCRGTITETCKGELAAYRRAEEFSHSSKELRDQWNRRLNVSVRGATVDELTTELAADGWSHESRVQFQAPQVGQRVQGTTLLLGLDVLSRDSLPAFPEVQRHGDVLAWPLHATSEVSVNMPRDGRPELPAPRELVSDFGRYAGNYEFREGRVYYRRSLFLNGERVPLARYPAFRQFLSDVAKAERTAILIRPIENTAK